MALVVNEIFRSIQGESTCAGEVCTPHSSFPNARVAQAHATKVGSFQVCLGKRGFLQVCPKEPSPLQAGHAEANTRGIGLFQVCLG